MQLPTAKPMVQPLSPLHTASETRVSFFLLASVLGVLLCAKQLMHVPYLGAAALTLAAFWQLRAPLWRVERLGLSMQDLGCHFGAWRLDARLMLGLALAILPAYAWSYHLLVTTGSHTWRQSWPVLSHMLQEAHPVWHLPHDSRALFEAVLWFCERAVTHTFGVALPEELFYRGYLQPVWQTAWPTSRRLAGVSFGLATVAVCASFAVGHFIGEWQLSRLAPFFPSLLFAWQRARSGTIVGAVGLHALCNLFVEVWIRQYAPGHLGS